MVDHRAKVDGDVFVGCEYLEREGWASVRATPFASATQGIETQFVRVESSTSLRLGRARLHVVEGPHWGTTLPLSREIFHIGRDPWCDLSLAQDSFVSRHHCDLIVKNEEIRIQDLGSRNGVYLEGHRIYDACLKANAHMRLGDTRLQLEMEDEGQEKIVYFSDQSGLLVGRSEAMRRLFSMIARLGQCNTPILLTGETGVGKSLVARALHEQSTRAGQPFLAINCGALPATLIEAELFGYEKGAFTGAYKRHIGLLEAAHGGTLFLDELDSLPLELQPKLLDALERRCFRRVGGKVEIEADFRLVCAGLMPLEEKVARGEFRSDLYYRLAVVNLTLPPLRQRREDIPLLVYQLLQQIAPERQLYVTKAAMHRLQRMLWPGNIRELRNYLEHALAFLDGSVLHERSLPGLQEASGAEHFVVEAPLVSSPQVEHNKTHEALPALMAPTWPTVQRDALTVSLLRGGKALALKQILEDAERALVLHALELNQGQVKEAAQHLQISQGWLYNRIKKFQLREYCAKEVQGASTK